MDALFEPDGHSGPTHVVEFYGQNRKTAWYNLLTKMGLCGEKYPERDIVGVGIFLHDSDIPQWPHWATQPSSPLICISLQNVLPDWLAREPDNPYVAVFAPLLIDNDDDLRKRAPALWQTVSSAPLEEEVRNTLLQVMEFWFFDRFRHLTFKEIWTMLSIMTPIQETKAYQSILAEGKAESLKRLLTRRFGDLPLWAEQRIDAATIEQMDHWFDGIFDATSLEVLIGPP